MSNLAEELQREVTTEDTVVTVDLVPVDSEDETLSVGDEVHVSVLVASFHWDEDTEKYVDGREFDFGVVKSVNEDGTVSVFWDSAGCGCSGARNETASDLTKVSPDVADQLREVYYLGRSEGYNRGVKHNQSDIRDALGLPHPSEENDN